ncbi:phytoene desaturase [candidate division KSB1 bacterium]|nr:phytoene desaturase [candidate division KSB1 bacterium]
MQKSVSIIGGGLAGLAGAIYLARNGFKVKLFEKNSKTGGKANEIRLGPYRFDTGPSLLTMPFVLQDLLGDSLHELGLQPVEPVCRYFFADGSSLDTSSDRKKMLENLYRFSPSSADEYLKFINHSKRIYQRTADVFLFSPIHEIKKLIRLKYLPTLLKFYQIDPFRTVHQSVSAFFTDHRLIQLFDRYATYNGSNPFQAPATLNIIPFVEYELKSCYIKNGMYRLVELLVKLAQNLDVEICTSHSVEKILYNTNGVTGIVANGRHFKSNYVLSNMDVVQTWQRLIDGFDNYQKKLDRLEPSLSGLVFLWGIEGRFDRLKHHNIFFSSNYEKEFREIFAEGIFPSEPTVYIAITSKKDPNHAPENGENWFVLVNMPFINKNLNMDKAIQQIRIHTISILGRHGIKIKDKIKMEKILTPNDFDNLYNSNKGSIYGLSSNSKSSAFKRPPNRDRRIKNLYFAGGSTHPGGGIPLVLLSGKIAAQLITEKKENR